MKPLHGNYMFNKINIYIYVYIHMDREKCFTLLNLIIKRANKVSLYN